MKKIIIAFLFFTLCGYSQKKYVFDYYAIYKGHNGFRNTQYKLITFGNSTDHNYIFQIATDNNDIVTYIELRFKDEKKRIEYEFTPFPFKDFNSDIHLKNPKEIEIYNNDIYCKKTFEKNEIINQIDSSITTTFLIYKNSKKKKIERKIEVISFNSNKVENQNFYFVHSNHFLNCNKISFLPNAIKSYKLIDGNKTLESMELVELNVTNFSIN